MTEQATGGVPAPKPDPIPRSDPPGNLDDARPDGARGEGTPAFEDDAGEVYTDEDP